MRHRLFTAMPNSSCDSRDHAYQGDCDSPVGSIKACRPSREFSKPRHPMPRYLESERLDHLWAAYVAAWGTEMSSAALTDYLDERQDRATQT